jgi:transcriptional regulator with XRE-family HTH domain
MTSEEIRMARALLDLSQLKLAKLASINKNTVTDLESGKRVGLAGSLAKLREVFDSRGVVFLPAVESVHGPGVALRWGVEIDDSEPSGLRRLAVLLHLA